MDASRHIAARAVTLGLLVAGLFVAVAPADAAPADAPDIRLGPHELGGVTRVFRYAVAQPDRSEIAYLFLTSPEAPGGAPQQVQVVGARGELQHLSDTDGADCTLERVRIVRRSGGHADVVYAVRVFSGDLKTDVASDPAPMDVSVFRPAPGGQPGDSSVVLRLVGPPRRSRPVCKAADVEREMARLSAPARGGAQVSGPK